MSIIVSEIQLEGKKEFCCGFELQLEFEGKICGQQINRTQRVLCDKCFERTFGGESK